MYEEGEQNIGPEDFNQLFITLWDKAFDKDVEKPEYEKKTNFLSLC